MFVGFGKFCQLTLRFHEVTECGHTGTILIPVFIRVRTVYDWEAQVTILHMA